MRPVALVFLLVLALSLTPYAVATLRPPEGLAFIGTFHHGSDFYNYLSYAQQAEEGSILFQNKAVLLPHAPALVNLEWWMVGTLSRLQGGGRLLFSYRLFAVLAAFGFLLVADGWLRRLGLGEAHRLPSLVLIATGGGLGGLLLTFTGRDLKECLDLYAGLFPFLGLFTNPHFTAGTALLLLSLLAFDTARTTPAHLAAVATGTALALVRPYDFVLLVLVRTVSVLVLDPPRRWIVSLLPLGGLVPVLLYLYWLFYRNPVFAFYADTPYVFPSLRDFVWALAPAALLAVAGLLRAAPHVEAQRARVHLLAWAGLGGLIIALRPVHFSLQFLVGIGLPLLALGAFGLAARAPRATLLVAVLFSTSQLALLRFVAQSRSLWFVPREEMLLVRELRAACRPGDVLFAPPSVGLLAYGLTPCRAFLSHPVDPGYREKLEELKRFSTVTPGERRALLDSYRVTHLLLPGDAGPRPVAWLGEDTAFNRSAVVAGGTVWSLYLRGQRGVSP